MTDNPFEQLEQTQRTRGSAATLELLCDQFTREGRHHEWFEAEKLRLRYQFGLPVVTTTSEELVAGSLRDALEEGLLNACREVGSRLFRDGRLREGWNYWRPVGDLEAVGHALEAIEPTDENRGELIELCVHEGLDLARGFTLLLQHFGTCNTITTYDATMYGQPRARKQVGARALVLHLHSELHERLIQAARDEGHEVLATATVTELLERFPEWLARGAYHLDTTHLASVVRIARDADDRESWKAAHELSTYGSRLDPKLQYADAAPFEALYETSLRYFAALLGESPESHVAWFRERAEQDDPYHETTRTRETYIDLLLRIGESHRAWEEALRLLPPHLPTTGLAPSWIELATRSGAYQQLSQLARERDDRLGFVLGLLGAAAPSAPQPPA